MKMIQCDRCGEVDKGRSVYSMGFSDFFIGIIRKYRYAIEPEFVDIDLCQKCQTELDGLTKDFMNALGIREIGGTS